MKTGSDDTKTSKKLMNYIKNNNISKFKSYIRKRDVNVHTYRLDHCNTLLHAACRDGSDLIVRHLLKCYVNLMLQNAEGQLACHLACRCVLDGLHKYVATDVLLPLLKACPASLDVADKNGITARMMMEEMSNKLKQKFKRDYIDLDNESCSSSSSDSSPDSSDDWNQRLADRLKDDMFDEIADNENFNLYEEEQDSESWSEWADRMAREHSTKSGFRTSNSTSRPTGSKTKDIPKISEEKKKEFERKMEKARQDHLLGIERRKDKARIIYERNCDILFKQNSENSLFDASCTVKESAGSERKKLSFDDIPWPHAPGLGIDGVEHFLFAGLDKNSSEYRIYLRKQQVRWHPDRFLHRCGSHLHSRQKQQIISKVKEISQLLNRLGQEIKNR